MFVYGFTNIFREGGNILEISEVILKKRMFNLLPAKGWLLREKGGELFVTCLRRHEVKITIFLYSVKFL